MERRRCLSTIPLPRSGKCLCRKRIDGDRSEHRQSSSKDTERKSRNTPLRILKNKTESEPLVIVRKKQEADILRLDHPILPENVCFSHVKRLPHFFKCDSPFLLHIEFCSLDYQPGRCHCLMMITSLTNRLLTIAIENV